MAPETALGAPGGVGALRRACKRSQRRPVAVMRLTSSPVSRYAPATARRITVRRRDFIATLGGAAALPVVGHTQTERSRRVGVLMGWSEREPQF
jgi:hypothetical protein